MQMPVDRRPIHLGFQAVIRPQTRRGHEKLPFHDVTTIQNPLTWAHHRATTKARVPYVTELLMERSDKVPSDRMRPGQNFVRGPYHYPIADKWEARPRGLFGCGVPFRENLDFRRYSDTVIIFACGPLHPGEDRSAKRRWKTVLSPSR